ncbi:hypothetical protein DL764_003704 [Monosporascus ibericus]|uniref:Uncharacterized protein n=1 Tax=Monosporascus ibericus TaxID=155417 RepID=A0A4Q4TFJ9_9PEZI|nr:hypothetical protein DL764_003704 [Monosporascus ibericus]
MSRVPLRCNPYTWGNPHDPKFAGTKFAALLRAQLLDGCARPSPTCQSCAVLGSVNCGHLSTRLKASKMKVASPGDSEPSRLPVQIYSCPGRHVYEGRRLLGGRYSSQRAKEWRGPREYLRGMCPRCWGDALRGLRGGNGPAQGADVGTESLSKKEWRRRRGLRVSRRRRELAEEMESYAPAPRRSGAKNRRWKLSREEEGKYWGEARSARGLAEPDPEEGRSRAKTRQAASRAQLKPAPDPVIRLPSPDTDDSDPWGLVNGYYD